jgi:hypothetical protein
MNRFLDEFRKGWNEVGWITLFSLYLLPALAAAVLVAYLIDGRFASPPSLLQILLAVLAGTISFYFAIRRPNKEVEKEIIPKHQRTEKYSSFSKSSQIPVPFFGVFLLRLGLKEFPKAAFLHIAENYVVDYKSRGKIPAMVRFYFHLFEALEFVLLRLLIHILLLANLVEIVRKIIVR